MTPIGYAAIVAFVGCAAAFVWLVLRLRQVD